MRFRRLERNPRIRHFASGGTPAGLPARKGFKAQATGDRTIPLSPGRRRHAPACAGLPLKTWSGVSSRKRQNPGPGVPRISVSSIPASGVPCKARLARLTPARRKRTALSAVPAPAGNQSAGPPLHWTWQSQSDWRLLRCNYRSSSPSIAAPHGWRTGPSSRPGLRYCSLDQTRPDSSGCPHCRPSRCHCTVDELQRVVSSACSAPELGLHQAFAGSDDLSLGIGRVIATSPWCRQSQDCTIRADGDRPGWPYRRKIWSAAL